MNRLRFALTIAAETLCVVGLFAALWIALVFTSPPSPGAVFYPTEATQ